ncbi:hypothetical protein EWM64_g442 [Hericium alpestre]|uniref:F-box domain-containing protein n=1 Tax=Hericium alpestre TaxID=135208 RepID=A0A4Z0AAJ9_9AGAM|nr:hypothetical protein EWM64_g442 [Hericium alpestre]
MSQTDCPSAFHRFPVELIRDIFEFAAQSDPSSACALSLVCGISRMWIEPILYHTVVIESARSLNAFAATINTKPASFSSRVKHLGIFAPGPLSVIHGLMSACQGVENLACGFSLPSYAKEYRIAEHAFAQQEQHLLSLSCTEGWDPTLLGPSVTRLRVHLSLVSWDPSRLEQLTHLRSLTHLAIVHRQSNNTPVFLLPIIRDILGNIPLRLLLVQVIGRPQRAADDLVHTLNTRAMEELHDPRLVAEAAPFSTVRQWESASRGAGDMWSGAESEVTRRRETLSTRRGVHAPTMTQA